MRHVTFIVALTGSIITLTLTLCPSVYADHRMGYGMMNDDTLEEMMPWGGHYGNRQRPYMHGQYGPGMGNMMGVMPMLTRGLDSVNLNKQQRTNIRDIVRNLRKKHWQAMEKNMDLSDELNDLYSERPRNASAIAAVYDKIFARKKEMIIEIVEARNKIESLLTKDQRKELDSNQSWGTRHGMGLGMMH